MPLWQGTDLVRGFEHGDVIQLPCLERAKSKPAEFIRIDGADRLRGRICKVKGDKRRLDRTLGGIQYGGMRRRAAGNEADTLFYETDKEKVKYAWQIRKNW